MVTSNVHIAADGGQLCHLPWLIISIWQWYLPALETGFPRGFVLSWFLPTLLAVPPGPDWFFLSLISVLESPGVQSMINHLFFLILTLLTNPSTFITSNSIYMPARPVLFGVKLRPPSWSWLMHIHTAWHLFGVSSSCCSPKPASLAFSLSADGTFVLIYSDPQLEFSLPLCQEICWLYLQTVCRIHPHSPSPSLLLPGSGLEHSPPIRFPASTLVSLYYFHTQHQKRSFSNIFQRLSLLFSKGKKPYEVLHYMAPWYL